MSGHTAEIVAGVYIGPEVLKAWREDAEERAHRADSHLVFAARIVRLIEALQAPCGSCHPCDNWNKQTWVSAGERLPHLHEYQEMRAELAELRARVTSPGSGDES
jgi:hypothetical protein